MIKSLPLQNKKVLVPRGEKQAKAFSALLAQFGGIPVEIPLIAFRPSKISPRLQEFLHNVNRYDWIIFTSNVAVETFFSFLPGASAASLPKIAVIGKKTEEILKKKGLQVEFTPSAYVAETFVNEFSPYVHRGMNIFIPKGNLAREYISESLRACGAHVDEAVVYETYMPQENRTKLAGMIAAGELDILLFTSPSTVDHFMDVVKDFQLESRIRACLIGCIGPVTEKKLLSYGLQVHASPSVYTVEEMVKSMVSYIEENSGGN